MYTDLNCFLEYFTFIYASELVYVTDKYPLTSSNHILFFYIMLMSKLHMPLDLCNSISLNLDSVSPGSLSLSSHTNRLPNHQGSVVPAIPTSNLNSRLPESSIL
jgi:hypothetical protein